MKTPLFALTLALVPACTPEEEGPSVPLAGTVTAESGESAEMVYETAFGVLAGGTLGVMVSPNPDSTCADAGKYFTGGDPDFNPEVVSGEGVCNLYLRVDEYDGTSLSLDDDTLATISMDCAMDTGSWGFEERTSDGYYYSGPFWIGSPTGYSLDLEGGADDSDITLTLSMSDYTGRFPYDAVNPENDPATGEVSGTATATWCEDIAPAL